MVSGTKLSAVFAAMATVLVLSIGATFWVGAYTLYKSRDVQRHQVVIEELQATYSTLKDAETGQRGFLLTGDKNYLVPYNTATSQIESDLLDLDRLAQAGELDPADVKALAALNRQKMEELKSTIELRKLKQTEKAVDIVKSNEGKHLMDGMRNSLENMLKHEREEFRTAQRSANHSTIFRTVVFIAVIVFNLAFMGWCYRRITTEIAGRESASLETRHQKDLMAVTLASIGDAVVVVDTDARITFLNEVAERLTGWSLAEANRQPCGMVFKIINEQTRAPVESPVEKVLHHGLIVGLANHTLLIRKDGSEIPIDDSGAPIRDAGGAVLGVVLVFRDFTAHKASETILRKAKEELESAMQAKDRFLAALSHELRTPLTPVLATLTTWEASDELPRGLLSDVQMLRRNVELEARLIDDLLDLTRIVKGKLPLNLEVVDVHELVQAVAGMYQSEIQQKRIRLTLRLAGEPHHARLDSARFQQICWNILKNATKFTPEAGSISIATDNEDGRIRLTFTDTGIGMSADTLAHLFEPFQQGNDDIGRRFGGLGLGMAITKALTDAQGGTVSAASDGPGRGATFMVTVPAVAAPAHPEHPVQKSKGDMDTPQRRLRILLVEDHADTAMVMTRLLRRLGHEVTTSGSVASAAEIASRERFDMLLSDIGLPDGTGIDLIRQIREHSKMPAVALTGFGMEDDIAKCREAGFDAHVTKPVNFQKLEMILHQIAAGKT